jgi:aspartokinase
METIAVYWEPQIKTYGIARKSNLYLVGLPINIRQTAHADSGFLSQGLQSGSLLMVTASPFEGSELYVQFLLDSQPVDEWLTLLGQGADQGLGRQPHIDAGVELVYFHGPHYGDRYGIAHAAFGALEADDIPLLSAACSGASVYLVLPQGKAEAACAALANAFVVPQR